MFTDLIPASWRKYVYAIFALAALCFGVWQASKGDWEQFTASLLAALVSGLAHGNTHPEDEPPPVPPAPEQDAAEGPPTF
jgi:hypothetical protein